MLRKVFVSLVVISLSFGVQFTFESQPEEWNIPNIESSILTLNPSTEAAVVRIMLPPSSEVTDIHFDFNEATPVSDSPIYIPEDFAFDMSGKVERRQASSEPFVQLVREGSLVGRSYALLEIFPFEWSEGVLKHWSKVHIDLETVPTGSKPFLPEIETEYSNMVRNRLIQGSFENPEMDVLYQNMTEILYDLDYSEPSRNLPPLAGDFPADFVIVCSEDNCTAAKDFLIENMMGVRTVIVKVEDVISSTPGIDRQDRIRNFLKLAFEHWGISSVLFAGNDSHVPLRYLHIKFNMIDYDVPTDLYYSCLDGNMNSDGDFFYGNSIDDDYGPELAYARLCFEDADDISVAFQKTMQNRYNVSVEYTDKWMFAGASLTPSGQDEMGQNMKTTLDIEFERPGDVDIVRCYSRFDSTGGDIELNHANYVSLLNEGCYFINQVDHGARSVLWTGYRSGGGGLFMPEVDALDNAPYFPIIYSQSCDINSLDHETVAQHWVSNPNGGGLAFLGNHMTGWSSQLSMDRHFYTHFLDYWDVSLGVVHQMQVAYMDFSPYSQAIIGISGYTNIRPYMGRPNRFTLEYDVPADSDSFLTITVTDTTGSPVEGAVAAVSAMEYNISRGVTDAEGHVQLRHYFDSEPRLIGISMAGFISELDTIIPVMVEDRSRLVVRRFTFEEDVFPMNMIPEAGELGTIQLVLENEGELPTISQNYVLSIPTLGILEGPFEIDYLEPGDSTFSPYIVFDVDSNLYEAEVHMVFVDYSDQPRDSFNIRLLAGDIELLGINLSDYIIDAGDTIVFSIELINSGTAEVGNAVVNLSAPDIEFAEPIIIGAVGLEEVAAGSVTGIVSESYSGGLTELTVDVSDQYAREWSFTNLITWPVPPDSIFVYPGLDNVELKWYKPLCQVMSYRIYRSDFEDGPFELLTAYNIWGTIYFDEFLPPLSEFYYYITTVDSSYRESRPSETVRGWTSLEEWADWPVLTETGLRLFATVTCADLDHDHMKETFVPAWNGALYCFTIDGMDYIDSTSVCDPLFVIDSYNGVSHASGHIWAAPACGDADLDGNIEIAVAPRVEHKMYLIDSKGHIKDGWPQESPGGFFGPVTMANLDDDPYLEIIGIEEGVHLDIWNHDGTPFFPDSAHFIAVEGLHANAGGIGTSSPAIGDLDGDGTVEIVYGGGTVTSAVLVCFSADGTTPPGWPIIIDDATKFYNRAPALGNMDDDFSTLEIAITGIGLGLCVYNYLGEELFSYPIESPTAPAIADVDDDGKYEIFVVGTNEAVLIDDDGTPMSGWPIDFNLWLDPSPTIADIDGDFEYEFLVPSGYGIYAFELNGDPKVGYPLFTEGDILSSPTVEDLNNDGIWEIIVSSYDSKVHVWDTEAPAQMGGWYTFCGNFMRTGNALDSVRFDTGDNPPTIPSTFEISASPNPFNSSCLISAPVGSLVEIFDLEGRMVWHGTAYTGNIMYHPDESIPSGLLLVKARHGLSTSEKKILLIK